MFCHEVDERCEFVHALAATGIQFRSHRNIGLFFRNEPTAIRWSSETKETTMIPTFTIQPAPTTFIVNVIHVHPGKQEEAFQLIQDVVHYVAERKPGFLWSNLAKSTDGLTVVNIEAISDPVFLEKFRKLDTVSSSEFHTYTVGDLVLPKAPA
jgi:hypothetical protein